VCDTRATYDNRGERGGRFCATQKLTDSIDVFDMCCEYDGCTTRANFNHRGERGGRLCGAHKLPGMVNVYFKALMQAQYK
jgi:hypothetical protein